MAELVDSLEERTMTWPEMVSSLQEDVRMRFGESAAQTFAREVEVARDGDAARDVGILMSICQCVILSETAEQLLARLQSIRPKAE